MEAVAVQREVPDAEDHLVEEAQQDAQKFIVLYDLYFSRIYGYVRVRVLDRTTCEDITSHIFMTALAKLKTYRKIPDSGGFGAWLFRIAQNHVRLHFRDYQTHETISAEKDTLETISDKTIDVEEQILQQERTTQVQEMIAALQPEQQHLLALRFGSSMSAEEIGQILGKTSGAIRVQLHRTLQELRRGASHELR